MMTITKRVNKDFSAQSEDFTWFVSIKEGISNVYERKDGITINDDVKRTEAIRIDCGQVEFWNEGTHWRVCREEIQRAYSDYIADKELLGDK